MPIWYCRGKCSGPGAVFRRQLPVGYHAEQIVVRAGPDLPDLRGNWLLGVYNNETTNVATRFAPRRRALTAAGERPADNHHALTACSPHGVLIQWDSVVGETYLVRFSQTLFRRIGPSSAQLSPRHVLDFRVTAGFQRFCSGGSRNA